MAIIVHRGAVNGLRGAMGNGQVRILNGYGGTHFL